LVAQRVNALSGTGSQNRTGLHSAPTTKPRPVIRTLREAVGEGNFNFLTVAE
jgi:hypothetical protein